MEARFVCSEDDIVGRLWRAAYEYDSSQAWQFMIAGQYKVMEAARQLENAELLIKSTAGAGPWGEARMLLEYVVGSPDNRNPDTQRVTGQVIVASMGLQAALALD